MQENEVIIVNSIPESDYADLIEECVRYAIISLPFTVDRMRIPNESRRALNIAKGKIAESLFSFFCEHNEIDVDFESCSTPFWTVDNRDFLLNDNEWDIKNNFYYCEGDIIDNYRDIPALVPNRFNGDQWSKRIVRQVQGTSGVEFLFTYLKGADLLNGNRGNEFLQITLDTNQKSFIHELYIKYRGNPQPGKPFEEDWFWSEMKNRGNESYYTLNSRPWLIITAFANEDHWHLFRDTGPYDRENNYQDYLQPRWYLKTGSGSCNFLNGTQWTKITNATSPISQLPSFLSLFPHLNDEIEFGYIKA